MSFVKLAVALGGLALLLPLAAHAQAPDRPPEPTPASSISLSLGTPSGLVEEEGGQKVVPYKGNVTVPVTVTLGCSLLLYKSVTANSEATEIHVEVEDAPAWLVWADVHLEPVAVTDCQDGAQTHTYTGTFPFSVAGDAPGVLPQTLNFSAEFAGVPAEAVPLVITIQFHSDYTVEASVPFPATVTGDQLDFQVTISNNANARGMVMVEQVRASIGTFSGLGSVVYQPPEAMTFEVSFKAPTTCWSDATVEFHTASHYLLLNQQAGSYVDERDYSWQLTNGVACTPGEDNTSKASPLGGLVLVPLLGVAAFLARRRL